jgi:hypothetical protein
MHMQPKNGAVYGGSSVHIPFCLKELHRVGIDPALAPHSLKEPDVWGLSIIQAATASFLVSK